MKFYITSSDQGIAIKIANSISRAGSTPTIAEVDSDDFEYIINDINNNIDSNSVALAVCQNPIKLALMANKQGNFNAVACNSYADFSTALEEGANFIAISDDPQVISEITSSFGSSNVQSSAQPVRQQKQPQRPLLQKRHFGFGSQKAKPIQKPKQQEEEPKEKLWSSDKGLKKNLKNIFGLE